MNHLGLFAKFWHPGTVKTRLAVTIGNDNACNLYRTFVFHLLVGLGKVADQRTVMFSPPSKSADFREAIPQTWRTQPQREGDLGNRMNGFFEACFSAKASQESTFPQTIKAIVIGADCPLITPKLIDDAFRALDHTPVVFGPSNDGGYYLLGMREHHEIVFANVAWSTPQVLDQSIQNLKASGIAHETLEPMSDIDEIENLTELQADFESRKDSLAIGELQLLEQIQIATKQDPRAN